VGIRKSIIIKREIIIIIVILFLLFFFNQCITIKDTAFGDIKNILLTENTIIINFSRVGLARRSFEEYLYIEFKNIYEKSGYRGKVILWLNSKVTEEWELEEKGGFYISKGTIIVDLTDVPRAIFAESEENNMHKTLFINEEARFFIEEKGGGAGGYRVDVFIGEDKVEILRQRYFVRRWRY